MDMTGVDVEGNADDSGGGGGGCGDEEEEEGRWSRWRRKREMSSESS